MDVVGVFRSVCEVIVAVKKLAQSAQSNKKQCKRFAERCEILMTAMRSLKRDVSTYREALIRTKSIIEEIQQFMLKFQGPLSIMDKLHLMRTSASDIETFSSLNSQLSQSCEDLKLGVLVDINKRAHEDILDARQDLHEIKDMIVTLADAVRENSELAQTFQEGVQQFNAEYHNWKHLDGKLDILQEDVREMVALLRKSSKKSSYNSEDPKTNLKVASQLLQLRKIMEDMATDSMSSQQHISLLCDISTQIQRSVISANRKTQAHVSSEMQRLREASNFLQHVQSDHHKKQMSMLKMIFNKMEAPTQPQVTHHQQVLQGLLLADNSITVSDTIIGKGGFGSVYVGTFNGSCVAVKAICNQGRTLDQLEQQRRAVESEVLLMHCSKHPGIIAVYGYVHSFFSNSHGGTGSLIVMELATRGSLSDLLKNTVKHDGLTSIPFSLAISWVCDIANALAFLHSNRILHRDVKPQNILLIDNLYCKISDFGLAKEQMSSALGVLPSTVGTLVYMAPEIKMNQGGNHRSDVYSLGVTTVQIFNRHTPSASDSTEKWINRALDAYHLPTDVNACLRTFLTGCLSFELTHRYSMEDAVRALRGLQVRAGGDPRDVSVRHADSAQVRELDDLARAQFHDAEAFLAAAKAKREAGERAKLLVVEETALIKAHQEAIGKTRIKQNAKQVAADRAHAKPRYYENTGFGMNDFGEAKMVNDDYLECINLVDFMATLELGRYRGRTPDVTDVQKRKLEKLSNKLYLSSALKNKAKRGEEDDGIVFDFHLLDIPRALLFCSKVQMISSNFFFGHHFSWRHMFLFNDVIVITSFQTSIFKASEKYCVRKVISLSHLAIHPSSLQAPGNSTAFSLHTPECNYCVVAESESEKRIWLEEIELALYAWHRNTSFCQTLGWLHTTILGTLHSDAFLGHTDRVKMHLDALAGSSPDYEDKCGMCSIHWAALAGHNAIIILLLEAGSDIDVLNAGLNSALLLAASGGHHRTMWLLLERGADMTIRNLMDRDVLFMAVLYAHRSKRLKSTLLVLSYKGIDFNQLDSTGAAPLHECAARNLSQSVSLLLMAGADVNCKHARYGTTALQIACSLADPSFEIIRSLLDAGAHPNWKDCNGETVFTMLTNACNLSNPYPAGNEPCEVEDSVATYGKWILSIFPVLLEIVRKGGRYSESFVSVLRPSIQDALQSALYYRKTLSLPPRFDEFLENRKGQFDTVEWLDDSFSDHCMLCADPFSYSTRRHHCRACGLLCCAPCSNKRMYLKQKPSAGKALPPGDRVCDGCYNTLVCLASHFDIASKKEKARSTITSDSLNSSRGRASSSLW